MLVLQLAEHVFVANPQLGLAYSNWTRRMQIRTYGVVRGVMLKHPPTRLFLIPEKEIRPETHALPSDLPSALRRRPGTRRVCQAPVSRGKAKAPGQELACGASLFLIGDGFELIFPEVNPDISVIIFQSAQGAPRHQHNPEFWLQGNRK